MKLFPALFIIFLLSNHAFANEFMMLGIYKTPSSKGHYCANAEMLQLPLKTRNDYNPAQKKFYADYNGRSPMAHLLQPDKATVVYSYQSTVSGFNCDVQVLKVIQANDVEAAEKIMNTTVKQSPNAFRTAPKPVLTWKGSEYKSTVTSNHDGIEFTYTTWKTANKTQGIVVKGKNNNKDKAATVLIQHQGGDWNITLQPGQSFTSNFKGEKINVATELVAPTTENKPLDDQAINWLKEKIREEVTTKGNGIKSEHHSQMGVRG
jgi:hypothetical protein